MQRPRGRKKPGLFEKYGSLWLEIVGVCVGRMARNKAREEEGRGGSGRVRNGLCS